MVSHGIYSIFFTVNVNPFHYTFPRLRIFPSKNVLLLSSHYPRILKCSILPPYGGLCVT